MATRKEQLENQIAALEASKEQLKIEERLAAQRKDHASEAEKILEHQQEEIKLSRANIELKKEQKKLSAGLRASMEADLADQINKYEQIKKTQQDIQNIQSSTDDLMGSIASKIGLSNKGSAEFLKNILGAKDQTQALKIAWGRAAANIGKFATAAGVAAASVMAIGKATADAVVEIDRVRAGFVGVTADTSDAMKMAERLTFSNLELAISFGEMSKAQVQLRTQFAQFGFLSDSVRESVTLQGAQLQKLGVDAGTTATIMNTLTMSFGQSATEAAGTQREIIGLGQALKIPPAIIARDFAQALPHLAQFGNQAVRVFEELSVAARQAGVSVSDLTGIFGDQFNTFEGAVGAAGRLNQALRSDVFSGMELLMADTAERQRMIKEGLRLSGVEFQNLERYEKLYIANAIGIRDVAQAAAILGDSQEQVAMRIGDTSFSMTEMEEMTKSATATMDKLQFVFIQLAVAVTPLADLFAAIIQGFLDFVNYIPGGMGTIVALVGALAGFATGGPVGAVIGIGSALLGGAAATGVGTRVGDAHFGPGEVKQIVMNDGSVAIPNKNDSINAAKDQPLDMINELKEIKNAILQSNNGGSKFVLEIEGRAFDAPVKRIIKDTTLGPAGLF